MKLTKKEMKRVLQAAEFIEHGQEEFSCCALDATEQEVYGELRDKYVEFYGLKEYVWFQYLSPVPKEIVDARVTLLLLFAEANQ